MSNMKMATCFVLVLVAMLSAGAKAQSGCTNVLISMSPCLSYITGNSLTPSRQCCSQLGSVIRSSPQCLCEVLSGGGSLLGITINRTQALALPGSCNVQTPPISSCNAASPMPADAPVGSPESGNRVPTGTEGGSKTVPSREEDGSSSNGSAATATTTAKLSLSLLLVVMTTFIQ